MTRLNQAARELIESGALAHLATINPDGSPQVSVIWVGLDGDDLVSGHLSGDLRKLHNLRRDPRVSVSFQSPTLNAMQLNEHLVVRGTATVTEGGAPELLARLARTYIGPDATFPPIPDPPAGFVTRIKVTRIGGAGTWQD
ncbi:PPOX class F420-dependent enzyme [Actinophytocola xinjiangensis]|uniref:PPOX class F420-dependent enzyme n=1 Tax=Actinophytocola xinjiangensis TaxID=485602 RepID=A0A7Z0WJT9_9PSEU|nr:PPOX class F420-dependent oxidoreductase [Actinophytocola xinjiangensis]OLF08746.1 PPOX class F420-dependent enzyme [Actinophytocola xinjiangensis]